MKRTHQAQHDDDDNFLFRVEILIRGHNSGSALEQLLRVLNEGGFVDYRIGSGIGSGRTIEEAVQREREKRAAEAAPAPAPEAAADTRRTAASPTSELEQRIRRYIDSNRLVRLTVNKGRGVRLDMPCRILNFDAGKRVLTVYHDDEKQVHSFQLDEVEDLLE